MDCTKRHLHAADINKSHWEEMAHDRSAWRTAVKIRVAKAKTKRATDAEVKRQSPMNVLSCLQIEQISRQSSHADTAKGTWRLVLANYPMKELVRENVERFAMLMLNSKPRRPPMNSKSLERIPCVEGSAFMQKKRLHC